MNTIEKIWDEYHSNLLSFIRKRIADKDSAEDILQDIFVRVHSKIDTLQNKSKIESWLYQITRNAIIDYYRARKPMEAIPDWLVQQEVGREERNRLELASCLPPMIQRFSESKEIPEKRLRKRKIYLFPGPSPGCSVEEHF
jgi:RNA polymerase sigma-70 factor, ECF subfamily